MIQPGVILGFRWLLSFIVSPSTHKSPSWEEAFMKSLAVVPSPPPPPLPLVRPEDFIHLEDLSILPVHIDTPTIETSYCIALATFETATPATHNFIEDALVRNTVADTSLLLLIGDIWSWAVHAALLLLITYLLVKLEIAKNLYFIVDINNITTLDSLCEQVGILPTELVDTTEDTASDLFTKNPSLKDNDPNVETGLDFDCTERNGECRLLTLTPPPLAVSSECADSKKLLDSVNTSSSGPPHTPKPPIIALRTPPSVSSNRGQKITSPLNILSTPLPNLSRGGIIRRSDGTEYVPESRRADGSIRRAIEIKPDYHDQALFEPYRPRALRSHFVVAAPPDATEATCAPPLTSTPATDINKLHRLPRTPLAQIRNHLESQMFQNAQQNSINSNTQLSDVQPRVAAEKVVKRGRAAGRTEYDGYGRRGKHCQWNSTAQSLPCSRAKYPPPSDKSPTLRGH